MSRKLNQFKYKIFNCKLYIIKNYLTLKHYFRKIQANKKQTRAMTIHKNLLINKVNNFRRNVWIKFSIFKKNINNVNNNFNKLLINKKQKIYNYLRKFKIKN